MKAQVGREPISNLRMGFRFPEFPRAVAKAEDEEYESLWDRVIRMCDGYGLKPARALSAWPTTFRLYHDPVSAVPRCFRNSA